jgi:hypothetical protein
MRKNEDFIFRFKRAFREDYGFELNNKQAKEAAGNLVDFFYLLWKFDREDKEKLMKMKNFKNEPESL